MRLFDYYVVCGRGGYEYLNMEWKLRKIMYWCLFFKSNLILKGFFYKINFGFRWEN